MEIPSRFKTNTSSFHHYWTAGAGVELLKKLPKQPDLREANKLVPYLFTCDEPADELVRTLHQQVGFGKGQQLLRAYLVAPENVDEPYKEALDTFFSSIESSASWLNWELLESGIAVSQRAGLSGLIVLRDYCLMGGYESAAINKPLIYTGALKKGAVKRLADTVDFWVDIMENGALKSGQIGYQKVMETRMIHAFSRINILAKTDWDKNEWGLPLNQWDMLATNLGFSLVFIVGLQRMKFQILPEEITAVLHLWKYIGYLLGIPLQLLPDTEQQAIEALYYCTMTQKEGDADSRLLAQALQEEPIVAYYPESALGRKMMREIHLYYNHFLLGSYSCRLLGLDTTRIGAIAYLNVLKNKMRNNKSRLTQQRQLLINKGRAEQLEVKRIYLTYNNRENNKQH